MKAEAARKLTDTALNELTAALEAGQSDQLTRYLKVMGSFHHYSFSNVMLIIAQRPDATHVAGFQTWKSLDRYVKKGEKGIVIIAPMVLRNTDDASGTPESVLRFRAVHVFDVSQTDGEPLPEVEKVSGDPGAHLDRLRTAIVSRGITLEVRDLGGAEGISSGGKIAVRPGLNPSEEFATLVHEFAHELLHQVDKSERPSKTVRETEAEAVAFVVSHAIGLSARTASADYIQLYAGSKDTLLASLDRVQRAASQILTALSDHEKPSDQHRCDGDADRGGRAFLVVL